MGNKVKKLEDFMKQQYFVILMKKNDTFYLHIPELSLIVEDKDLNNAYERLEKEKQEYFRKTVEMNLQDTVEPPALPGVKIKKNLLSEFAPFITKLCIIFLAGFLFLNLTAAIVRYASYEIRGIPYEIINKMNNMPEEEIQRRKLLLRGALNKLKPFIDEFKAAFGENLQEKQ